MNYNRLIENCIVRPDLDPYTHFTLTNEIYTFFDIDIRKETFELTSRIKIRIDLDFLEWDERRWRREIENSLSVLLRHMKIDVTEFPIDAWVLMPGSVSNLCIYHLSDHLRVPLIVPVDELRSYLQAHIASGVKTLYLDYNRECVASSEERIEIKC